MVVVWLQGRESNPRGAVMTNAAPDRRVNQAGSLVVGTFSD